MISSSPPVDKDCTVLMAAVESLSNPSIMRGHSFKMAGETSEAGRRRLATSTRSSCDKSINSGLEEELRVDTNL